MEEIRSAFSGNTGSVISNQVQVDAHKDVNAIMGDLTEIATMAHGSGLREGSSGGKGHIGVLNGKTIKFNTKFSERWNLQKTGVEYDAMMQSCDDLRKRLMQDLHDAMDVSMRMGAMRGEELNKISLKIMGKLGFERAKVSHQDRLKQNRGLLERTAVAESITMIRDLLKKSVRTQEPKLSEAESSLLKKQHGNETSNYDFHIWRKVKAMNGHATPAAGSAKVRYLAAVEKQVARIKDSSVNVGGVSKQFSQVIRETGNKEMKNILGRIQVKTHISKEGMEQLKLNYVSQVYTIDPVDSITGYGMLRLVRANALAKSMDAIFVKMKSLYVEKRRAEGLPEAIRSAAFDNLGNNPVENILKRSLAKLLKRPEEQVSIDDLLQEKVWLSPNEYENLKSLMRNELLDIAAKQGTELVKERPDAEPKLSALMLLTKDLFHACAQILDNDNSNAGHMREIRNFDTYEAQGIREANGGGRAIRTDICNSGSYGVDDIGTRVYTNKAWEVFNDQNYGVNADIRGAIQADDQRHLAGQVQNGERQENVEVEHNLENVDLLNQSFNSMSSFADLVIGENI